MSNKIQVNVLEPDAAVKPADDASEAEQALAVPDTGVNGHTGISVEGMEVFGAGLIVVVMAVIALVWRRKREKSEKVLSKQAFFLGLLGLAVFSGAISFATLTLTNGEFNSVATVENPGAGEEDENSLTVRASDVNIDVTIDDAAAYAMAESKVIVSGAARFGYNLSVYASDSVLSREGGTEAIKTVSGDNIGQATLVDNTWGLAVEAPESQNSAVWYGMPNSLGNALTLKSTRTESKEDEVSVYYGVYATPDLPYGTYIGPVINYVAVANIIPPEIIFDFDGYDEYFFDEAKTQTINSVGYARFCEGYPISEYTGTKGCEWTNVMGEYKEPIMGSSEQLIAWLLFDEDQPGSEIDPTEEALLELLRGIPDDVSLDGMHMMIEPVIDVSFTVTYDANGGVFEKDCDTNPGPIVTSPESRALPILDCAPETITVKTVEYGEGAINLAGLEGLGYEYKNGELVLLGWSSDPNADVSSIEYRDRDELLPQDDTLYAVWGPSPKGTDDSGEK